LYASPIPAHELETRRLLLGLLLRHTPGNLLAYIFVALISVAYLWTETGKLSLWWWIGGQLLMVAIRARWYLWARKKLDSLDAASLRRAETQATVLVGLSGLTWGSLVWLVFDGLQPHVDLFTTATLIGMTGGAVTPLSSLRRAFPLYTLAILLPYISKSVWIGTGLYLTGSLTIIAYMAVLLAYSQVTHRALWQAFSLQLEKDGLIAEQQTLSRSRSLFLAGVSHDLRQPVQALGLFTGYLQSLAKEQSGPLGEELRRLADNSKLALAAINGQVSRLLELSRLEAGEVQPRKRPVRLADLFDYTRVQQAEKAQEKGLELHFAPTQLIVDSDLKMLQSILDNLVSNAVRYTPKGKVLVGARRRGGRVEIQVLDTGPGIPEAHIPLLFEAYRRFDDTARGAEMGHGLGLALVQRQAQLLGHELKVHSAPGQGSVFSVLLPRHAPARPVL
jgi:signal transduction histidine kinase